MGTKYIQCSLRREVISPSDTVPPSTELQTTYLPSEFAHVGKGVKLKDSQGDWEDGWVVTEVYKSSITDEAPDWRKMIRGHRNNTGDSLPK